MFNKFINLPIICLFIIYIFSITSYFYLESYLLLKLVFLGLGLIFIYFLMFKNQSHWLVFLTIYLSLVMLYNCLVLSILPLWLIIILFLIVIGGLSFVLIKSIFDKLNWQLFYSLIITLALLEIFLILIIWPINNQSKGIVLLSIVYSYWGVLELKIANDLNWKRLWPFIFLTFIVIGVIISTVGWIGY